MSHSKEPVPQGDSTDPETTSSAEKSITSLPRFLTVGLTAFVITCIVVFLSASMIAPEVEPGYPVTSKALPQQGGVFRVTVDAADRKAWVPINLSTGAVISNEHESDILVQRYIIRAPNGGVDLGTVNLEDAKVDDNTVWTDDTIVDGQLQNPVLSRWYSYSYFSHLLKSDDHTYAVRLRSSNGVAYYRVISYYCEPERTSCLTIHYRLEYEQ